MENLGDGERLLLRALLPAVVGEVDDGAPTDGFERAIDTMIGRMAPADRRGLRFLFGFLQVSPLFYFRGRNLTGLTPAQRQAHFDRLSRSRFPPFRRAAYVAKTLVAHAWYGQPTTWPAIDYGGPWRGRVEVERLADPDLGEGSS